MSPYPDLSPLRREEAYNRAARATAMQVEYILAHIQESNYGQARAVAEELLDALPHVSGPVEHYPLFENLLNEP